MVTVSFLGQWSTSHDAGLKQPAEKQIDDLHDGLYAMISSRLHAHEEGG